MPPTLLDYQYALGETGFVLNTDFTNTIPFVDVLSITGLDSAPQRINTTEREGSDGTYVDNLFQSIRTIVITANVYTNAFDPDTLCDLLRAQFSNPTVQPFYFKHPGKPIRFINVQGGGALYAVDTNRRIGVTPIQLSLLAGDPYIYDYPANFAAAAPTGPVSMGLGFNSQVNFLSVVNSGFEGGTGTWLNLSNSTLADTAVQAHSGVNSLQMTSVAAGLMTATHVTVGNISTGGAAVSPGDFVTCNAWFRSAVSPRSCEVGLAYYDITGTVIGSNVFGTAVADTTSGWTQVFGPGSAAPANAVWVRLVVGVQATGAANEVHYVDDVFLSVNGLGFNVGFGGSITPSLVSVGNFGSHTAYPIITINGPTITPAITDSISNINMMLNISLAASDILTVDCRNKTILVNGISVRSVYNGINFFSIPPGTIDTFFTSLTSGSYSATVYNTYY
jgi:hypothetical protein